MRSQAVPWIKRLLERLRVRRRRALHRLGPRSKLVLMKLGFDMRSYYEDVLHEPVPSHLMPLVERLPGAMRDVIDLRPPSEPEPRGTPAEHELSPVPKVNALPSRE
jgi:hypothetical protein